MRLFPSNFFSVAISVLLLCCSQQTAAGREARSEINLLMPYAFSKKINFDGGASAGLQDDLGIGFGYAYNYTDHWSARVDMTWNTSNFTAQRIVDSTISSNVGDIDTVSLLFGSDYYFFPGAITPYVNINFGWIYVDSNVGSYPNSVNNCWSEPWLAKACKGDAPDYSEKNMVGGLGLGIRFEFARRNFLRMGYYQEWIDFDQSTDLEGLGTLRFEFGFLY